MFQSKNRKFETRVFDKRDDFNFEVVKYPSMESNIHDYTLHAVFLSQLIRYARVCNKKEYFLGRTIRLYKEIRKKGASCNSLNGLINKYFKMKHEINKFTTNSNELLNDLFQKLK